VAKTKGKRKGKDDQIEEPAQVSWSKAELFIYAGKLLTVTTVCLLVWISCITFDGADWPNQNVFPTNDPVANWCGVVGAYLSYTFFHYFGQGAWTLLLSVAALGFMIVVSMDRAEMLLRTTGMILLVAVSSSLCTLVDAPWSVPLPAGAGGILGLAIFTYLSEYFSRFGTALLLLLAFAIGLILAVDEFVVYLPVAVRRTSSAARWLIEQIHLRFIEPAGKQYPKALPSPSMIAKGKEPADAAAKVIEAEAETSAPDETPAPIERIEPKIYLAKPLVPKKESKPGHWPKDLGDWVLPPLALLNDERQVLGADHEQQVRAKAKILERTLGEFKIDGAVVEIDTGPVVTMFELQLGPGTKVKSIDERSKDLARALKSPSVRVVAPIPGKNTIGIEVPNLEKQPVRLRELIELSGSVPQRMDMPLFLGKDASGNPLVYDLTSMPHLLIAGTTGSGKSVCINSLITSLLLTQRPDHVKMILVDPKMVELSAFKEIPHLMCPVVNDVDKAEAILEWLVQKMEERYSILSEAQVRNIHAYNRLGREALIDRLKPSDEEETSHIQMFLPYIVLVIDELADLMMVSPKEVELYLARVAQKSRAVGIHMILATQRPEAKVVTGLIKSNLPARVAFRVNSRLDSRIVMDQNGAEDLLGGGDMLFLPPGSGKPIRAQGTLIDDIELRQVLNYLKDRGQPEFHDELMQIGKVDLSGMERDEMFDQAVRVVLDTQRGSVSLLQRKLTIGYSRAARLIEQMAVAGIVGEYKGSQAREVSMTLEEYESLKSRMTQEVAEGMTD
jgi:S-DNA-T family DNA segregation ATPase FtsK/SpoIIIE